MLQIFEKYAGKGAFQPEELFILVAAFDDAWKRLENSGVDFIPIISVNKPETRSAGL